MCKIPTCYLILPTTVKFLEIRFAGLEAAQCCLMLDKKQLESDNQVLSTDLACTSSDLWIAEERRKKTEDERIASFKELALEATLLRTEKGLLLERIRSLQLVKSIST